MTSIKVQTPQRKPERSSKTSKMEVLISPEDKQTIIDTATALNMSMSEYVRECCLLSSSTLTNTKEL
jgi:hypothetical protein